jgi:hypothetical protein
VAAVAAAGAGAVAAVMMVCGFVLAWQRFYDEDKAIDEEMREQGL